MIVSRTSGIHRATEYLIHADIDQLSPVLLYRQINAGFTLFDVQTMLTEIAPHSAGSVLRFILGKSVTARLRLGRQPERLTAQQSAVAFMYARVFELAFIAFGSHHLAEQWLGQPCRALDGDVPLYVVDNPCAFRLVEAYLQRIEFGIYQ
ncbi:MULTISPECIES: antitoxin Xre/MbcA/ParS toxin-binding domain-containing protein [unclassified Pseudomonas]|uniref:antitoxin Xre/MbcA/ParS toxin-binding domain-containing protein n=1 Tax=unclassified Pseudomonas TaxID=196821 RepID=UPI001E3ED9A6|nr:MULTISPECIES: antitoxin Xre/MbcA/ParS toxin-binding domain-containing protein [unclassified Pseudomonas]MCE0967164.1 DUF2384 domain-containing protein [Pseudomonas sp. NMI4491_12]MCE1004607.1 DUF2384 domain-containing protein [Pseudomonas sp. NMI1173_11]